MASANSSVINSQDVDLRSLGGSPPVTTSLKRSRANSTSILDASTSSSIISSCTLGQIMLKLCQIERKIDAISGDGWNYIPLKISRSNNSSNPTSLSPPIVSSILPDSSMHQEDEVVPNSQHISSLNSVPSGLGPIKSTKTGDLVPSNIRRNRKKKNVKTKSSTEVPSHLQTISKHTPRSRNVKSSGLPPILGNSSEVIDGMTIAPKKRSVIVRGFTESVSIDTIGYFLKL
ncbi:hypothetical protein SNEBB_000237 [Seison nebaliae]|nr:hypothetical protein SNEBB_000237 [Seison nebaliae]